MEEQRYYYKAKVGNGYLNLKSPLNEEDLQDYDVITEQEFIAYTTPQTRELSQTQIKKRRIAELKRNLQNTDYQAIKYAEGELSAEDYASTKAQRQSWRAEINQLESELQL